MISPEEFIQDRSRIWVGIDVRSEGEFADGSIPGSVNLPILTNSERHEVGWTYKNLGQTQAIELGHRLVEPNKLNRIQNWVQAIASSPTKQGVVFCWRGGQRSAIASQWIREAGVQIQTVRGGYKAIRGELLNRIDSVSSLVVLAGATGSGKTELLRQLPIERSLDLEHIARHRGSAFGGWLRLTQPSQATFENCLGFELGDRHWLRVVEDESRLIGKIALPQKFKQKMIESPVVILESPLSERVQRIFAEYVADPILSHQVQPAELLAALKESLSRIMRRLGIEETQRMIRLLDDSFLVQDHWKKCNVHEGWILALLNRYYDPMYEYSFNKQENRKIMFRGNKRECLQWISDLPKQ